MNKTEANEIEAKRASHLGRLLVNLSRQIFHVLKSVFSEAEIASCRPEILMLVAHEVGFAKLISQWLFMTKQATSKQIKILLQKKVLLQKDHPTDKRAKILGFYDLRKKQEILAMIEGLDNHMEKQLNRRHKDDFASSLQKLMLIDEFPAVPLVLKILRLNESFGQNTSAYISAHGFPEITFAKIFVFGNIPAIEEIAVAELVRRRFISRQAMHSHLKDLQQLKYIVLKTQPANKKALTVRFTAKGHRLLRTAIGAIHQEEHRVAKILGQKLYKSLKQGLGCLNSPRIWDDRAF